MMNLKEVLEKAEQEVKMREDYNTTNYINGLSFKVDSEGRPCLFVDYDINYDEDRPCDFGFVWFKLDYVPTDEELEENNISIEED